MTDSPDKIQWHPAFCAATELELQENIDEIYLYPEYNLSKEPIRIDLLILKDQEKRPIIKNEIGRILKTYNIMEYKSPDDGMTIDDFYKTLGYACLYKGLGKKVNQIPSEEMTISMFRDRYPREMIRLLRKEGYQIEEKYPGIYYVTGQSIIAAQIIVISQLEPENHSSLRILTNKAQRTDVERFFRQVTEMGNRSNIDAVLQASVSANYTLYQEVRRSDEIMCQALEELMKDVIDEKVENGRQEGIQKGIQKNKLESVCNLMDSLKLTAEEAMDALRIPDAEQATIMKKLSLD